MGRRGGSTVAFASLSMFHVLYKHITCIHTPKFNVQYRTVILFLYFLYPNYEKNQLPLPCFNDRAFSYFSCLNLHDFTPLNPKIFWGSPPRPINYIKLPYHPYVLCTEACNCTKDHSLPKINLNVKKKSENKLECK